MKNVLFVLAALSMVACEKEEKAAETVATDVAATSADSVDAAQTVTPDVVVSEPDVVTATSEVTPTK